MELDIYKIKYIKYKKKYDELKKLKSDVPNILKKIIIVPKEYIVLGTEQQKMYDVYELNEKTQRPISYIKKNYVLSGGNTDIFNKINSNDISNTNNTNDDSYSGTNTDKSLKKSDILTKNIILPDEYFLLSDSDKAKYEINESDYDKFPNRVVPKNYKKIKV